MWISLFLSVRKWLSIWLCCIDDRLIRKSDCLSGSICCCSFADALGFTLNLTSYNNFAQWRYSNQWSNREVLLLLVENYTQYPAPTRWNTLVCGNFWLALRGYYLLKLLKWTVLQSNPETNAPHEKFRSLLRIASRPFGWDQCVVSVLIKLISDTGPCVPFNIKQIFARGWGSGACSGLVTSRPGIAVPPVSAHFPLPNDPSNGEKLTINVFTICNIT